MDHMIHRPSVRGDDFTRYERFKEAMGMKPKETKSVKSYKLPKNIVSKFIRDFLSCYVLVNCFYLETYRNFTTEFGKGSHSHQPHHVIREPKEFYNGEEVTENSTYHLIEGKFDPFPFNDFNYKPILTEKP